LNSIAGGNFDLRPVIDNALQMFSHDISAFYATHVKKIRLHGFDIEWGEVKESYFTNGVEFANFEDILIEGYRGCPAPSNKNAAAIFLENGNQYRIENSHSRKSDSKFIIKKNVKE
jgi:hypothetical protein